MTPQPAQRRVTTPLAADTDSVNARFARYLDHAAPPQRRRHVLAIAVLIAALLITIGEGYIALFHSSWAWLAVVPNFVVAVRAALLLRSLQEERRQVLGTRRVIQHGVPVIGYVVQANPSLSRPGTDDQNCLVLLSFQPEVAEDADYMRWLAGRVRELRVIAPRDADGRAIAALTQPATLAGRPAPYRRRRLPLSFTDGSLIFCADLRVRRDYLPDGRLIADRLPCLAEPGDEGGVELVPASLAGRSASRS